MTNEEAIELLDNLIGMIEDNQNNDYDEALKMGIKALEILEFAKKELQFAVEHTETETKEHYQRALNLLK